jgi:hypothetical protein
MDEVRDIAHPELNGNWQVSGFKFLIVNSADLGLEVPTRTQSRMNS